MGTQKNPLTDGSLEHPKHMFKLMDKKIIASLRYIFFFLSGPIDKGAYLDIQRIFTVSFHIKSFLKQQKNKF